jgi:flagellar biosynthesis GTPase FlhF
MSIEWYRVYHGMPEDAKLRVIAKRSGQLMTHVVTVWLCVLDAASRHATRGTVEVDSEQIAVVQEIDQSIVESILRTFYEKGMIGEDNILTGWKKRQYLSDAERAKRYREGKKQDDTENNAPSRSVTKNNTATRKKRKIAPDTDNRLQTTDSESRKQNTDKKNREREEKGECERKKHQSCGKLQKQSGQILQQMADIWNEEVQSKLTPNQKAILTPKRKELLTLRWLEDFQQDIRAWKYYCEIIGKSEFCLGKLEGKGWTIDLTWAVESSEHIAKILEGGFSNGKHPTKPPSCDVPELQEAWDFVIDRLQQKFGKSSIRSWFGNTAITKITSVPDGTIVTLETPRKFIRDWIEQHFLKEVNSAFNDQPHYHIPVIATELTIKEQSS